MVDIWHSSHNNDLAIVYNIAMECFRVLKIYSSKVHKGLCVRHHTTLWKYTDPTIMQFMVWWDNQNTEKQKDIMVTHG